MVNKLFDLYYCKYIVDSFVAWNSPFIKDFWILLYCAV